MDLSVFSNDIKWESWLKELQGDALIVFPNKKNENYVSEKFTKFVTELPIFLEISGVHSQNSQIYV